MGAAEASAHSIIKRVQTDTCSNPLHTGARDVRASQVQRLQCRAELEIFVVLCQGAQHANLAQMLEKIIGDARNEADVERVQPGTIRQATVTHTAAELGRHHDVLEGDGHVLQVVAPRQVQRLHALAVHQEPPQLRAITLWCVKLAPRTC